MGNTKVTSRGAAGKKYINKATRKLVEQKLLVYLNGIPNDKQGNKDV